MVTTAPAAATMFWSTPSKGPNMPRKFATSEKIASATMPVTTA